MPDVIKVEDKYYILATATRAIGNARGPEGRGYVRGVRRRRRHLRRGAWRAGSLSRRHAIPVDAGVAVEQRPSAPAQLPIEPRQPPVRRGPHQPRLLPRWPCHAAQGSGPRLSIPIPVERRDARARAPHQLQSTSDQADPGLSNSTPTSPTSSRSAERRVPAGHATAMEMVEHGASWRIAASTTSIRRTRLEWNLAPAAISASSARFDVALPPHERPRSS